jgi:uridine kinase
MLTVGIAGGTGSGKPTVVKKVIEAFPNNEVIVIPQDSYYRDNSTLPLEPSKRHADPIITGDGENQVGIETLISIIERHLLKNKL